MFITCKFATFCVTFSGWVSISRFLTNNVNIFHHLGMDKSYQRGDIGKNGVVVKVTPAHWSKKGDLSESNTMSCWYKEDSKWSNRRGQTVVPLNVKKFKVPHFFILFFSFRF